MFFIYRFLIVFFYPLIVLYIYLRKIFKKEDKYRFKEKIFYSFFLPKRNINKKLLWFHAASLGEVKSIFPLISKLNETNKNLEFLITTVTLSSGRLVEKKYSKNSNINHRYFPIDINFLIKKFLDSWQPDLIIFVDSEIWPNFLLEIKKRNIRSVLVNGRITKKTFDKWIYIANFARKIFNTFDLCLSSSKDSETYLKLLNVKNLKHIGNLKFTGNINIIDEQDKNKELFQKKKVWCAVSTHKGEEDFCFKTHIELKKKFRDLITIIIPRHIDRTKDIQLLCNKLKLKSQIVDDGKFIEEICEIIIINSFGTLPIYLRHCQSVFMGKSMIKKIKEKSGQNPIEAVKLGCKVYHGPYVHNFKEIYNLLQTYELANEIKNEIDLANNLTNDFNNSQFRKNNKNELINALGEKILCDTIKEINKFLI